MNRQSSTGFLISVKKDFVTKCEKVEIESGPIIARLATGWKQADVQLLNSQKASLQSQIDFKDREIRSWKDRARQINNDLRDYDATLKFVVSFPSVIFQIPVLPTY